MLLFKAKRVELRVLEDYGVAQKGVEVGDECEYVKDLNFVKKHGRNEHGEEDSGRWGLGGGVETNQCKVERERVLIKWING